MDFVVRQPGGDILIDPCGSDKPLIIDDSTRGNITTPNYPNNYPSNADCHWEIQAQDEEAVVLRLHSMKIERELVQLVCVGHYNWKN